jgi:hypothetical protein
MNHHLDGLPNIEHIQHEAQRQEGRLDPEGRMKLAFLGAARRLHLDHVGVVDLQPRQLVADLQGVWREVWREGADESASEDR